MKRTHEQWRDIFRRLIKEEMLYIEFIDIFGTMPGHRPPPGIGVWDSTASICGRYVREDFRNWLYKKFKQEVVDAFDVEVKALTEEYGDKYYCLRKKIGE